MTRICVFCGSSPGTDPDVTAQARLLGHRLAQEGIGLVYGGAGIGVMGAVADACLKAGGEVTGVIPKSLMRREVAHPDLTKLIVVESMHNRKALMSQLSEAFIALPGGFGTFEEIFEMITWSQLSIHDKPMVLVNVNGFYNGLDAFLRQASASGYIRPDALALYTMADTVDSALDSIVFT